MFRFGSLRRGQTVPAARTTARPNPQGILPAGSKQTLNRLSMFCVLYKRKTAQISRKSMRERHPHTLIHKTTYIYYYIVNSLTFFQTFCVNHHYTKGVNCKREHFNRTNTKGFFGRCFCFCVGAHFFRNFCLGLPPVSSTEDSTASSWIRCCKASLRSRGDSLRVFCVIVLRLTQAPSASSRIFCT